MQTGRSYFRFPRSLDTFARQFCAESISLLSRVPATSLRDQFIDGWVRQDRNLRDYDA